MFSKTIAALSDHYLESPAATPSESELELFAAWIRGQYLAIPCHVEYSADDINLKTTREKYNRDNTLIISTANNYHPWLSYAQNAMLRAVHDWHHVAYEIDDTFTGECLAYVIANSTAPKAISWILFSEMVLQAAVRINTGEFPTQKLVR